MIDAANRKVTVAGRQLNVDMPTNAPQGINDAHITGHRWKRHASPGSVLLLSALLIAAALGYFGGQPHPRRTIDRVAATISMEFPEILRNGQFFEMRAKIRTKQDFTDLRVGISTAYWHDLTINSMVPAPEKETTENGEYRFSFGPVKAGEEIVIKIDGQINPSMFAGTRGQITLLDGDKILSAAPVELTVLP